MTDEDKRTNETETAIAVGGTMLLIGLIGFIGGMAIAKYDKTSNINKCLIKDIEDRSKRELIATLIDIHNQGGDIVECVLNDAVHLW